MRILENVKQTLTEANIPFIQRAMKPDEGWSEGICLEIEGGCKEAPLYIEFGMAEGRYKLFDLHFGRYSYELYEYEEEAVLSELIQNIRAVMEGKTQIICSWYAKSRRWNSDACYYLAPGEEDDDSDEYRAAIRRIERPKGWFARTFSRRVTYAVYNWNSYREITR